MCESGRTCLGSGCGAGSGFLVLLCSALVGPTHPDEFRGGRGTEFTTVVWYRSHSHSSIR